MKNNSTMHRLQSKLEIMQDEINGLTQNIMFALRHLQDMDADGRMDAGYVVLMHNYSVQLGADVTESSLKQLTTTTRCIAEHHRRQLEVYKAKK